MNDEVELPGMEDLPSDEAKVFLSYSRKDRVRAQVIAEALRARHFGVFRDTDDILPTEEWRERLQQLIEEADTIVFLLSPHSAESEVCAWEVRYAADLNKRIAPIVIEDVGGDRIPPLLARQNFIFCTPRDPFENAVDTLISALNNDIGWIREHTRLAGLAARWEKAGRPTRLLLRGQDIADAETWRDGRPKDAPEVTPLHATFIGESRRAAGRRQRNWIVGVLAVAAGAILLALFAWLQSVEAERQRGVAEASALSEALARFRSESRLADAIADRGDGEAWRVLHDAAIAYAEAAGHDAAFAALDGDTLRIALGALLKERVLAPDVPADDTTRMLGFFDEGRRLVVHAQDALIVIDARSGEVRASYPGVGAPLFFWPGGGANFAVVVCRDAPCLSTFDQDAEDAEEVVEDFAVALFGEEARSDDERLYEVWDMLISPRRAAEADLTLGKLEAVFIADGNPEPVRGLVTRCGADVCQGAPEAPVTGELAPGFGQPDSAAGSRLRLADGWASQFAASPDSAEAVPAGLFDPADATTQEHAFGADLLVRTSYLSAEVEIFRRAKDGRWEQGQVCLDWDEEYEECAGGLVGVTLLDASLGSGLMLATSYNQGTGGGNGSHHTSLIDLATGTVVWRADRVSAAGAFSPDGATFALIDWLGALEVRETQTHDRIYDHPSRVARLPGAFVYAPQGDLAAVLASDGSLLLLDVTDEDDLAMTRQPLESQRSACRETDAGPFRAIARPLTRPFSAVDWAWQPLEGGGAGESAIPLPDPDAEPGAPLRGIAGDEGVTIPLADGRELFVPWTVLESGEGGGLDRETAVLADVSDDGSSLVLWGTEAPSAGAGTAWFWLARTADSWTLSRSGRVDGVLESPSPVTFATDGGWLAFYGGDCLVHILSADEDGPEHEVVPAFENHIGLTIDTADGVLEVISHEWYGALAVQLFDLRTGASGPWLNIADEGYPEGAMAERPLLLHAPPWGDRLRRMILETP